MVKFSDLSLHDKRFRIVNLCVMGAALAAVIAITAYHYATGDPYNKVSAGYIMAFFALAPLLFELIFRTRLPNVLFLGAEIYLIVTGVWGSIGLGYIMFDWLDIVVHTLMGYIMAMIALFVISRVTDYKKLSVWGVALFCFAFSLGVELIWELGEWTVDNLVGQTAQGLPAPGYDAPLVTDTMQDLLCNFSGALAFALHFLIGKLTAWKVGISTIERELAFRRIRSRTRLHLPESQPLLKQDRILKRNKNRINKKFVKNI